MIRMRVFILFVLNLMLVSDMGYAHGGGSGIGLSLQHYKAVKKKEGGFDKNRLFAGGGLGAGSYGSGAFVTLAPMLGYRLTDRLHVGSQIALNYFSFSDYYTNFSNNNQFKLKARGIHYTWNVFARYFPIHFLFLQVQPEYNNFKIVDVAYNNNFDPYFKSSRLGIPSVLVGGGYAQPLGKASYMMLSAMYDVLRNPNSPYYNRIILGGGLALGLFGN